MFEYTTDLDLSNDVLEAVESSRIWTESARPLMLLLRGILANGILVFALSQKRWRVNYGLATRSPPTKLAVPCRPRDSPTLMSEFSHPDIVITLTSLCHYYEGLSDDDLSDITTVNHTN